MKKRSITYCQIKVMRNGIDTKDTEILIKTLGLIKDLPDSKRGLD